MTAWLIILEIDFSGITFAKTNKQPERHLLIQYFKGMQHFLITDSWLSVKYQRWLSYGPHCLDRGAEGNHGEHGTDEFYINFKLHLIPFGSLYQGLQAN